MSRLFVITYKRPAMPIETMTMGEKYREVYDCEAVHIPELADIKLRNAKSLYDDVEMFECDDYEYVEFCKNDDAYLHFVKTGEHSMKPINEAIDVDVNTHSEKLLLALEMKKDSDGSFDYTVDIDDVGQIVITPTDIASSFESINRVMGYDSVEDIIDGNVRKFVIQLEAAMISDDGNFSYFLDVDELGQAIITPDSEATSFLSVSVSDSLNLITESILNEDENTDDSKRELCVAVLEDIQKALTELKPKYEKVKDYFRVLNIDASVSRAIEEMLKLVSEEAESTETLIGLLQGKNLKEELSDDSKQDIITRFMQGNIGIFSDDGEPLPTYERLPELDYPSGKLVYEYYYDSESDSVISYARAKA